MPTLGETVRTLEERLFVDRQPELATFRRWLSDASGRPEILNVTGPGGVGKTVLLGAFRRVAEMAGRAVVQVDARTVHPTPEDFLVALGGGTLDDVLARLNDAQVLLLVDSFEELAGLSRFLLDAFVSRLEVSVRVVVAGRSALPQLWPRDDRWHRLIRLLPLVRLPDASARVYLARRGLADQPRLVEEILAATRRHPLGLSLAADLAEARHLGSLKTASEWPLVVRSLVERLHGTENADVRALLEAAALVREFDEAVLLAIAEQPTGSGAFARLCTLSVVRPSPRGLALHDDVRHILAMDLRWRDPARHAELQRRALAHYRERARSAPPEERERLLAERLFLWEDGLIQTLLFGDEPSGEVWLDGGLQEDHPAIRAIWAGWLERLAEDQPGLTGVSLEHQRTGLEFLEAVLAHPGTRLRVARDPAGRVLGFSTVVPISGGVMPLVEEGHPALARLLDACSGPAGRENLPATAEASTVFAIVHLAYGAERALEAGATLLRGIVGSLARGGMYLCASPLPLPEALLEALGFDKVPGATVPDRDTASAVNGYVLDLAHTGVEPWVEALLAGRRPVRGLAPGDFERELQAVLAHWREDSWLSHAPLWNAAPFVLVDREQRGAEALRELVAAALRAASSAANDDQRMAYRALELAYLTPGLSHEAAAQRLAVSRATLYRLLRRGVQGLARVLRERASGFPTDVETP